MNLFKVEFPFRRPKKAKDPTEETRSIAECLYLNRQTMKRSGNAESDWAQAERILKSPLRTILFHLNQFLIRVERRAVEPFANWVDRADLFRIIERLSPTIEALGVIAIPLVLFFATQSYEESLRQQELERVQQQAITDYLNQLSAILMDLDGSLSDPQNAELRTLTTATTLTLLRDSNLDGARKGQVIQFLSEMGLVQREVVYGPQQPEGKVPIIELRGANLSFASLRDVNLSFADLHSASLRDANLSFADLHDASLWDTDLSFAFLRGADLSFADLRGASLRSASLRGADLSFAFLRGADLRGASLRFADLRSADLRSASLRSAFLHFANFRGADFRGADLSFADFRGADFRGADLSFADFRGVKNLTRLQLESAYLCATQLPEDITLNPDRDCESSQ